MSGYNTRAHQTGYEWFQCGEHLQNTYDMSRFCSSCGGNHYTNQCWGAQKELNYIGDTNRGQWSPYSNTYEQTIQDHVFNEFQQYNRRFCDVPNYYEVPQPPDPTPKLKEMLIEGMLQIQNAIQRLERQVEQLLHDRKSQPPESLLGDMVNTCCEAKDFGLCSENISSEPENGIDVKEEEILDALDEYPFENTIELNLDDGEARKDNEVTEMEVKKHQSIHLVDPSRGIKRIKRG